MRLFEDLSPSALIAGFVAVLVGFTSSAVIVFQAAQTLHATAAEIASWMWALGLGMGPAALRGLILPEASVAWGHIDSGRLALSYEPRFKSVGVAIHYGPFFAGLRTDRGNLNDARAVGATAGLALRF